ncbi:restriction endonuclease [Virgibacillus flavescens]|uniref:restriction endonuclease n=1 Tax=Virgibacillus flavescens TaxID=1611422 RepID=UPI003D327781
MEDFINGFGMGFDLLWSILSAEPKLTALILLFIGSMVLVAFIVNMVREYRLKKSGMLDVDEMPGRKFEEYLQVLLRSRGYKASLTPETGDYGADLILSTQKKKIIVQAKRYKKNVGIKAVQEIASAKSHYRAEECWVITNSFFTQAAKNLALSNKVRLIDRNELMGWMINQNKSA